MIGAIIGFLFGLSLGALIGYRIGHAEGWDEAMIVWANWMLVRKLGEGEQ